MIVRHSIEQVDSYYDRIGLNQSSIKVILGSGMQTFLNQRSELMRQNDLYYEEKKHFVIGSAIDCKITMGEDIFNQKYHTTELTKKPGDSAMSVIRLAYDKAKEEFPLGVDVDIFLYKRHIIDACNQEEYYLNRANSNIELDTRMTTLLKSGAKDYWMDLVLADGKQVLSSEEQTTVDSLYMSLTTHKHTCYLFKDNKDVDIVYQFPLYFSVKDIDCKGMIDMIRIDHSRKRIMPIDLKSFGNFVLRFPSEINRRRYDIQGSFYLHGLERCINQLSILLDKPLVGYEIANFAFIVESTLKSGCPLIYVLSDDLMRRGKIGNGTDTLGWVDAINLYKQWEEVDFSIEKMYESTNGILKIDVNTVESPYN